MLIKEENNQRKTKVLKERELQWLVKVLHQPPKMYRLDQK